MDPCGQHGLMEPTSIIRRLAAVMIADVVGYSRLMERDESGTHVRIRTLFEEVIEAAIQRHHGRLVKKTGDGALAEFPSATEAVRCAVEIQRACSDRNRAFPDVDPIQLRIGLTVADVLFDEADIAGGGVNLAARLETLAPPGGICISQALREQIHEDLGVVYVDGGLRRVKNISKPVRVIQVRIDPPTRIERLRLRFGGVPRGVVAVVAVAVVAIVALAAVLTGRRTDGPPTMSLELGQLKPTDPSDLAADRSAKAVNGRLFLDLAGNCNVWVLTRPASESSSPASRARYRLDGGVSNDAGVLRFDVRVLRTDTDEQVWGDSFILNRPNDESFRVASHRIGNGIDEAIGALEIERLKRSPPRNPSALELALLALGASGDDAKRLYERALKQEPDLFLALKWLSQASTPEEADRLTMRAVAKVPQCTPAWFERGNALVRAGRTEEALSALDRGLQIDPYDPSLQLRKAEVLFFVGRWDEAVPMMKGLEFMFSNHRLLRSVVGLDCRARLFAGTAALQACSRWSTIDDGPASLMYSVAAAVRGGDTWAAKQFAEKLRSLHPRFTITTHREGVKGYPAPFRSGLEGVVYPAIRTVGIPES
jgi:adenylate cyclase